MLYAGMMLRTQLNDFQNERSLRIDLQLDIDPRKMGFHRIGTDPELLADFLITIVLDPVQRDLHFSICQIELTGVHLEQLIYRQRFYHFKSPQL